jgi:hypothetical protein
MLKRLFLDMIVAAAARPPPRAAGIDGLVASMLLTGPLLGIPIFMGQLILLRLATHRHPLLREPYLTLGSDSICIGIIAAAELMRIWKNPIESQLAACDRLGPRERLRFRAAVFVRAAAAAAVLIMLLVAAVRQ